MERAKRNRLPKVGDVLRMEVFTERNVVAHYVRHQAEEGPFVNIYEGPRSEGEVLSLGEYKKLFGPVVCGINPPVRSGDWTKVGHIDPPADFKLPLFLAANGGIPPHDHPFWFLLDVERGKDIELGYEVPAEYRNLDILGSISASTVEERVQTGRNIFSYEARMSNYEPLGRRKK